ncbi:hypothetical protein [Tabrizicola sp.]|nr:hypothetical protein [Tabrizicola sp.]
MDVFMTVVSVAGIVIASVALGVQIAHGSRRDPPNKDSKGSNGE